ncbi:MAG: tellurium resistance protein [Rhodobacteraceae bacterium]|nr:MAG: tellurium resistance protein [Paracoccaceae bacterium]
MSEPSAPLSPARARRPMPPPLRVPKPGLWRRTPPAIFPPIMGLFGLGLGWRAAGVALADAILGAATLLLIFALLAYLAKPLRRPASVIEDLRVLPGRAGLSAASLSVMLMAASLAPFAPRVATLAAIIGFGMHASLVGLLLWVLISGPPEGRVVTPVFHLSFVGFIIGGLAANALGYHELARWVLWVMLVPAGVIWGVSARQLKNRVPPAPLRPLLVIHLAPACLFAIVASGAGMEAAAYGFMALAAAIAVVLLVSVRWLTAAGFTPLWGAFTFPSAAFATALLSVSQGRGAMSLIGLLALGLATLLIVLISYRILKMWPGGTLAAKTNASEA